MLYNNDKDGFMPQFNEWSPGDSANILENCQILRGDSCLNFKRPIYCHIYSNPALTNIIN